MQIDQHPPTLANGVLIIYMRLHHLIAQTMQAVCMWCCRLSSITHS